MRARCKPILIFAVSCLCLLAGQTPAAAQSWANGCLYRRTITIDHTKAPNTDQADFPVLIAGTYSYLATTANGGSVMNANGYDILFASDPNGVNPLPFEQESYNPSTGAVVYWVKVPSVSHTTDTVFYMFYGNSSISADQSNKAAVWDSSYKGVWHLPNGTSLTANDSTGNSNNGTITGATATSGALDGAASLSGSTQYINVGNGPSLQITGNAVTIEAWLKTSDANPAAWQRIVVKQIQYNWDPYIAYGFYRHAGTNLLGFMIATGGAGTGRAVETSSSLPMGTWTHVVGTYDGSNLKIYMNATLNNQSAATGNIVSTNQNVGFGFNTATGGDYFNGSMDEVRISNVARSADWTATAYNNQGSPSTFYSVGTAAQGTMSLSITQLSPSTANFGDSILIQGTNFGTTQGASTVSLNGTSLAAQTWTDTAISVSVPFGASTGYFTVTVNGQTAISPLFTVKPIPSGWSDADIGSVGAPGSASYANGTFIVKGAGQQILGTSDSFNFLYRPLSWDGTITARVVSVQGGSGYASAGAMIRESLAVGSTNAKLSFWPVYNTIYFDDRPTTGGNTSQPGSLSATLPYWVRVVRAGNTFSAYRSSDGMNWVQIGTSQTINMAQNVDVGLAVNSGASGVLATATFDSLSIDSTTSPAPIITSLSGTTGSVGSQVVIYGTGFGASQGNSAVLLNGTPMTVSSWSDSYISATISAGATSGPLVVAVAPSMNDSNAVNFTVTTQPLPISWLNQDLGSVGIAGSATYANGTFTVQASGGGISGTSDGAHMVYRSLAGDGSIVARVVSSNTAYPQAGMMIRESLNAWAPNAFVFFQPNLAALYYRPTAGGSTGYQSISWVGPSFPYWVKLTRAGNTFTGYISSDGTYWTQTGTSQTITMAQNAYIGLAVSSTLNSSLTTVSFDNVSVSSTASPAPVITNVSATTGSIGSQVVITGTGFGGSQGSSAVYLNGAPVTINSWSTTSITITMPTGATSGYLAVAVAPSMNSSNAIVFTVTSEPLPSGWLDQDVGQVGLAGSATYANGTFTVKGAGQIAFTSDKFHFAYRQLLGDGAIVAKVSSIQGGLSPQVGVMIRETLNLGSTHAFVWFSPNQAILYSRTSTDGSTNSPATSFTNPAYPYWVKLIRNGNTFSGYISADGTYWTQVATSVTVPMASNVYVGLAVSSDSTSALTTATFDNVSVTVGTTPLVTGLSPNIGGTGTAVTITGLNFGATQGTSTVTFNGALASVTSWSATQIIATVPSAAPRGAGPITVTVNSIPSLSSGPFTVIRPEITSLTPPAGQVGGSVTLSGVGFGTYEGDSKVKFNGVVASVSSWSDTSVTVTVPATATTGPVTLTEYGVTSNGVQFTVNPQFAVTAVSPATGPVGTSVTFTGVGFGVTQSNSTASFYGDATATVTSWSDTQIVAVVPAGAATGPVAVKVAGVTAQGPTFTLSFTVQLTDSRGYLSSYTSVLVGGQWLMSDSQGSGCSSCTSRGVVHNTFNGAGNILSATDELGRTTSYTYDSYQNVTSISQAVGGQTATTTYTYNSFGQPLTVTNPLGQVTTNAYDAKGNLTSVTTPAPDGSTPASVTQFAYDVKGQLTQITDPLNRITTLTYTTAGLIATITDAQNNVTSYAYDARGNRTSVTDANNKTTTFTFDAMNRLTRITYPDFTATNFAYDTRGRRTSVTDANNKTTTYAYDNADRLTSVTDANNQTTTYAYDTENNLVSITDANAHTTFFTYDAFGRVTQANFPSTLTETYAYDAVGNLTSKTDRKGQTIQYVYDALNRLTHKGYPDATGVDYVYDLVGKIQSVNDPTGTYAFAYDNMGRLVGTTTSYSFLTGRTFTTSYSYDKASNRTGFTDPENGSTTYAYDTLNRLTTLTPPAAFTTGSFGFSYDALSRRTQMTRPNNVTTNYSYDNLSRLLSVLHQLSGSTIDGATYTVDNVGNRISKGNSLTGVTENYTYDAIYEVTQVVQGGNTTESYTYDAVGNRLSSLGVSPYNYNVSNQFTSKPGVTFTYDNNGNTVTKNDGSSTTTYAWDFENRLASVTLPGSGGTVTFKYDPFGRRVYKTSSSGTSVFAHDGDNLIEETNSSGTVLARYAQTENIDEPLAMLRSGATSFYNADGLGSVTSLANAAGALAQTYTYDSFGKSVASSGSLTNPIQYTAREFDPETNLYFYRARYYDQAAGRFLSEDPTGFAGGMNVYDYALNSPVGYFDPLGLDAWKKTHGWGRADIQSYSKYMKEFVKSYPGNIDCGDLALLGLINFASSNGLPVNLKYYSNGRWSSYNAQSSSFSSVAQYTNTVLNNMGALNVIDNTHPIGAQDLQPGDLLMSKWNRSLGHTRIVTDISCKCAKPEVTYFYGNLPPARPQMAEGPLSGIGGGLLPQNQIPRRWRFGSW